MYQISKKLGPYPFAHRQPNHDGHCKLVHGHNWYFEIRLEADELDENGFVFDFGKFKKFNEWMNIAFDHTMVISHNDPKRYYFEGKRDIYNVTVVQSASAEGLAQHVADLAQDFLRDHPARVVCVTCYEDEKNSATYFVV